jgi:hypothetical protein
MDRIGWMRIAPMQTCLAEKEHRETARQPSPDWVLRVDEFSSFPLDLDSLLEICVPMEPAAPSFHNYMRPIQQLASQNPDFFPDSCNVAVRVRLIAEPRTTELD